MFTFPSDWHHRGTSVVLRNKTKVRISPLWPDVVEVLCQFSDLVIPGTFTYWFPLAEMGPIPNGTILNADGLLLDRRTHSTRKVMGFVSRLTKANFVGHGSDGGMSESGAMFSSRQLSKVDVIIDDQLKPVVGIPVAEFVRTNLAACSLIANELMDLRFWKDEVFERFCDPDQSGWVSPGHFHVTPKAGFASKSDIFQLALLLTDQDYVEELESLADLIRVASVKGITADLSMRISSKPRDLVLALDTVQLFNRPFEGPGVGSKPRPELARVHGYDDSILAAQIISDLRKPLFNNLTASQPFDFSGGRATLDEIETDFRAANPSTRSVKNITLVDDERPSLGPLRIGKFGQSFFQTFPNFRHVKFKSDTKFTLPHKTRKAQRPPLDSVLVSRLPKFGNEPIYSLSERVTQDQQARKPEMVQKTAPTYFSEVVGPIADLKVVPRDNLSNPLIRFWQTGITLENMGAIDSSISSTAPPTDEALVLEFTRDHGPWAWRKSRGRGRRAAFLAIQVDNEVVYAVEFERMNPSEYYAIGLILLRTPKQDVDTLNLVVSKIASRAQTTGERKIWPETIYPDVKFDSVIHSRSRQHFMMMAAVLKERAHALVAAEYASENP